MTRLLLAALASLLIGSRAVAQPVGELHLVAHEPTATLRAADHSDEVRVTVWYPAAAGAPERPLWIGRPGAPSFDLGSVAPGAAPAASAARWPVVLLSHGFGGTARVVAWFGVPLARSGMVVVAVDHPGNNARDPMTVPAVLLWWDRAADLRAALHAAEQDGRIGPRMDAGRVGVAGFSAGGGTALVAAGARVEMTRLEQFCAADPDDGLCRRQIEFSTTPAELAEVRARPEIAAAFAHDRDDHRIAEVRAAFAMAPALVPSFDTASLAEIRVPVEIVLGTGDTVATPATNGLLAARLIPHAELLTLPGASHYDFLAPCTPAGVAAVAQCKLQTPNMDRAKVVAAAVAFFAGSLGGQP